jgi:DMSO/TMAO reductase YedYZ molybdopterin-dependent catalytic subunit
VALGPFRADFWRSPLRGRWLTSVLGLVLLIGLPIVALTGLLSNDAYQPQLGDNLVGVGLSRLDFHLIPWPTHPSWLYAFTQGMHVTIGLALVPVLLAKLWSVIPRLFEWPPIRSPAHALERLSLLVLVGSALFEFITGIADIQYWVPWGFGFSFTPAHYYGGLLFIVAFTLHAAIKLPTMRQGLKLRRELAAVGTGPERPLASPAPLPMTFSRRALLGTVGAGSLLLFVQGAGQAIGGAFRSLSFLGPRSRMGPGPNGFPINHPAAAAGLTLSDVDHRWRLTLSGAHPVTLTRAELLAMPQYTYDLPIACVEGWSTTQRWTGVRLRDLAALAGVDGPATVQSVSVARTGGDFNQATLGHEQLADERTLLALRVNGVDLSLDHGYPARVIGPALPGVHCTKWVGEMRFEPV